MLFSVIVPVYKVEEYLSPCVESILGQTCDDYEIILVDDGSPDACPAVCDQLAKDYENVKVIHKENGGLTSARRAGIRIAEGDYVLNLDSDDRLERDSLETARRIIRDTACDMIFFAYRWVDGERTVKITNDGLEEGLYGKERIQREIFPRLLMDENMNHCSYYLAGKVIKRELLTPHQLAVSEEISLGEDLCCTLPCTLEAKSVYVSRKPAYLYTVRVGSLSKKFNSDQILLLERIVKELYRKDHTPLLDFEQQLSRYFTFMCFAILAAAAEGNHYGSIKELKSRILSSAYGDRIQRAAFSRITIKSRITLFLMKKSCYRTAFFFLNLCKTIRNTLARRSFS